MSATLKVYDLNNVVFSFFGLIFDSGFDEDNVFTLSRNSESFTTKVGADGEVARSKTNDKSGEITLKLLQTSEGNDKLSVIALLDEKGNNGSGVGPFMVKDLSGTTLLAGKAWVKKRPDMTFSKGAEPREWTLGCIIEFEHDGGN